MGRLAQLVRAPALHAGRREFESLIAHFVGKVHCSTTKIKRTTSVVLFFVDLLNMNDLQKKLAIIGLTTFIIWTIFLYDAYAPQMILFEGSYPSDRGDIDISRFDLSRIDRYHKNSFKEFINLSITGTWHQASLFATWLGSFIAFNIYKD